MLEETEAAAMEMPVPIATAPMSSTCAEGPSRSASVVGHPGSHEPAAARGADPDMASAASVVGTDRESRKIRRAWRERLNAAENRKLIIGFAAALLGGSFWGFSGTSASYLFSVYQVDTLWLMSLRQLLAGALFIIIAVAFDRKRLVRIWTTREDRRQLLLFTAFGLFFNQLCYLFTVRLTNAGTATVLQCLQLVLIMGYTCIKSHRSPRRREVAGIVLALAGTFLIATGGDITRLSIPPLGLAVGLLTAVGAACMVIIPAKILPAYGSTIVTGSAMFLSGVVTSLIVQPWAHMPALDMAGWQAMAVLVVVGSFLAYFLYMQGVKDIGSVRASLIGTVEPVSATVTSAIMLGTVFAPTDIAGFVLIIVMVFLTV